jgi:hypothetical protein
MLSDSKITFALLTSDDFGHQGKNGTEIRM